MKLAGADRHNRVVIHTKPTTSVLWPEVIDASESPQQMQVQFGASCIQSAAHPPSDTDTIHDRHGFPRMPDPGPSSSTQLASHNLADENGNCLKMHAQPASDSLTDMEHSHECPLIFELDFGEDDAAMETTDAPVAKMLMPISRDAPNTSSSACDQDSQPQSVSHVPAPGMMSLSSKPADDTCTIIFLDHSQEAADQHCQHYQPTTACRDSQQSPSHHLLQLDSSNMTARAHHTSSPRAHHMLPDTRSDSKAKSNTAIYPQQGDDHCADSSVLEQGTSAAFAAAFLQSHVQSENRLRTADDADAVDDQNSCPMMFDEDRLHGTEHRSPYNNAVAATKRMASTQDVTTSMQHAAAALTPMQTRKHAGQVPGSMEDAQTHHRQTLNQKMSDMHNRDDQSLLQPSTMLQASIPCSPDDIVCSMVFCDEEHQYDSMCNDQPDSGGDNTEMHLMTAGDITTHTHCPQA